MRAAFYDDTATDNSTLQVGDLPDPKVGPGTVLIEVKAAGVNPVDWKVMAGGLELMMDMRFPAIPGWDVAGVVVETGPDVPEFSPGDEVMAYARKETVHAGTFAQYVAVDADAMAAKPSELSWEEAGALPLAGLTALRSLRQAGIYPDGVGKTVLVHAAAGGVGSMAVQLAKAAGARVIGTASPKNFDYLRTLGAEPVEYGEGEIERVQELAPDGVDAVTDFVGGVEDVTLAVLREGGEHTSVADPGVLEHGGHYIWVRPSGSQLSELGDLVSAGELSVSVEQSYGLDGVGDAFDASRSGKTRGKLVIVP